MKEYTELHCGCGNDAIQPVGERNAKVFGLWRKLKSFYCQKCRMSYTLTADALTPKQIAEHKFNEKHKYDFKTPAVK